MSLLLTRRKQLGLAQMRSSDFGGPVSKIVRRIVRGAGVRHAAVLVKLDKAASVSFRGCVDGGRRQQSTDVLNDHVLGLQVFDRGGHVRPQARAGDGSEPGLLAARGHDLTGELAAQDVHRLDVAPVDDGDVAEVRGVGPVVWAKTRATDSLISENHTVRALKNHSTARSSPPWPITTRNMSPRYSAP